MHRILAPLFVLFILPPVVLAQGTGPYLNFEAPSHHAIAVVDVGGRDVLAVCNAPDNSVEIYTASDLPTFLCRVPVGQEPVTIVAKPTPIDGNGTVRCYTANWLGDSITAFDLTPRGNNIDCKVVRSMSVGDEPMGLAFLPATTGEPWTLPGQPFHEALIVTFNAQSAWGVFDPFSLFSMGALPDGSNLAHRELFDPTEQFAVKEPAAVLFDPTATVTARMVIANRRGGNTTEYDFDLWITDNVGVSTASQQSSEPAFGGLGTTNFDAVFRQDGVLYVCGHLARNNDFPPGEDPISGIGEVNFQKMVVNETGFTTSFLARVTDFAGTPTVGQVLDLNLDPSSGTQHGTPVTQPTAIAIYDTGDEATRRIFVTGFSSDTIGVIQEDSSMDPAVMSVVDRIDVRTTNPFTDTNLTGTMRGPRALVVRDVAGTDNDRLFVYNRVEHSITVIDAAFTSADDAVLNTVNLQFNPTPDYIHEGRKFMYSSELSGGGNASCSSCHVDSNTDFLAWNLSDNVPIPAEGQGLPGALGPNPPIKGPMVTQPLRGIVNFEVADQGVQQLYFTNRPYHWRADRGIFQHFNGAFINLMGIANPHGPGEGISPDAMDEFTRFTNSVHYPPNPDQQWDRRYTGTMYDDPLNPDPVDLNTIGVGSGAARGLKLFHIQDQDNFSCVGCHTLPEASNNRLTENLPFPGLAGQSLETAQMKALALKDKRLIRYDGLGTFTTLGDPNLEFGAVTGEFGATHTGFTINTPEDLDNTLSLNSFIDVIFNLSDDDTNDLSAYTREFDTGVSPLIGFTYTVNFDEYNVDPDEYQKRLTDIETQALEANCGIVIHAFARGDLHGFFFDVTDLATPYHEVIRAGVTPIGNLSQGDLFNLLDEDESGEAGNFLTLHCTPLGSDRRLAFLDGGIPGSGALAAPTDLVLLPCIPMTANELVPGFTGMYQTMIDLIVLGGVPTGGIDFNPLLSQYIFQESLLFHAGSASPPSFGLPELRHETPRRFCISGTGIEHGAILRIFAPTQTDVDSSPPGTMPNTFPVDGVNSLVYEGPIYPARDDLGNLIWETAVENDPMFLAALMNGGPHNAPVANTVLNPINLDALPLIPHPAVFDPTQNPFQPLDWNWYYIQVQNDPDDDTTIADGGWWRMTIF